MIEFMQLPIKYFLFKLPKEEYIDLVGLEDLNCSEMQTFEDKIYCTIFSFLEQYAVVNYTL